MAHEASDFALLAPSTLQALLRLGGIESVGSRIAFVCGACGRSFEADW